MALRFFPANSPQAVRLPPFCSPEGLSSFRVNMTRENVPKLTDGVAAVADDDGFFPIHCVYTEIPGCQIGLCNDITAWKNDALSRCSIFLDKVFLSRVDPALPPIRVDFRIKMQSAFINETLFQGTFNVPSADKDGTSQPPTSGLIVFVNSPLCTGYELWARVTGDQTDRALDIRTQFIVDRLTSGQLAAYPGVIAGSGGLPIVFNPPPMP